MMNDQKFIPELHDIGKLVDEKVKEVNIKVLSGWAKIINMDLHLC